MMDADDPRSVHLYITSRAHATKNPPRDASRRVLFLLVLGTLLVVTLSLTARLWLG